ncbi:hypothetical protein Tco_1280817 [Tanacetum coccineum]
MLIISSLPQERCINSYQYQGCLFGRELKISPNTIKKIRNSDAYNFNLDKKKCRVDTEVFHEILQICPILPNQEFVELPSEEDLVSFIKELGYSGKCYMLSAIHTNQMHQPWKHLLLSLIGASLGRQLDLLGLRNHELKSCEVAPKKARKFKKIASPSRKLSPVKEAEPVKKAKRVKRPAKKSTAAPTAGVVIRYTPGEFVSNKKAPAKVDRGKGIELLLDAALLDTSEGVDFDSEVPDESIAKPSNTSEGTGVKPGVPDMLKGNSSDSDNESWGNSEDKSDDVNDDDNDDDNSNDDDNGNEDDDGNDSHDSERIDLDNDENSLFTLKDYDKEEHDEEYESHDDYENVYEEEDDDLYKDVDVRLLGVEHEKERKGDEEITDADQNVSQEKSYEQVVKDAHVTLTSSQKTESSKQSSSVSSDFASKVLILDNVPPIVNEVASMMNVKNGQEESST